MARKKEYVEEEVLEKAMALFWRNGYENTSVRMLEKEMGINQFSIYASFGSKRGVFLKSIDTYKRKIQCITSKLKESGNGVAGIKQYFYDFLDFSRENNVCNGCLVTNTVNELGAKADPILMKELILFANEIRELFNNNLKQEPNKSAKRVQCEANYLMTSILGISVASKVFSRSQLADSIETIFSNL